MEYQKNINFLDSASNQPSKCRTKNWVEINDDAHGTYNKNPQIKFKAIKLKPSFCNHSDAYILFKRNITVKNTADVNADANNTNRKVIFKYRAPFRSFLKCFIIFTSHPYSLLYFFIFVYSQAF